MLGSDMLLRSVLLPPALLLILIATSVAQSAHYEVVCRGGSQDQASTPQSVAINVEGAAASHVSLTPAISPRRIMFVQDASRSMAQGHAQALALTVIQRLIGMAAAEDRLALVDFSDDTYFDIPFSAPPAFLHEFNDPKLWKSNSPRGGTSLYDAVFASAAYMQKTDSHTGDSIVVISDGLDNESRISPKKLLARLIEFKLRVYWIALAGPSNSPDPHSRRDTFSKVVADSGGFAIRIAPREDHQRISYDLLQPDLSRLNDQLSAVHDAIERAIILQFDLNSPLRRQTGLNVIVPTGSSGKASTVACPAYISPN